MQSIEATRLEVDFQCAIEKLSLFDKHVLHIKLIAACARRTVRQMLKIFLENIAFYPERRKVTFYLMGYKIIMWLSVDDVGSHAV